MNPELLEFVAELSDRFDCRILSIWLFGSRANGNAKALSDWDLLVFSDRAVLEELRKDEHLHRGSADLLVVYDGDNFEKPWGETKSGSLSQWKWQQLSPTSAQYESIKFYPDEPDSTSGSLVHKVAAAQCLYRAEG